MQQPARTPHADSELADWLERARALERAVKQAVVGQDRVIRLIDIALFARGHVLLEGDVGVGKTTLLRAFARAVGGEYARIEGTVDLTPSDLLYYTYIGEDGRPRIEPGPLLQHGEALVNFFFNEINRARPQVHSLLLRVMAERTVHAFNRDFRLPHLTVFADRNRVEKEETFEIASAARDRFMMEVSIGVPLDDATRRQLVFDPAFHDTETLLARVDRGVVDYRQLQSVAALIQREVRASAALERYALDLWQATRDPRAFGVSLPEVEMDGLIVSGASPRGMSMLLRAARVAAWMEGRDFVTPEDVHAVVHEALAHRLFFAPVYELRRQEIAPALLAAILQRVAAP